MTIMNIVSSSVLLCFFLWLSIYDIRNKKIPNISFPIILFLSFFINNAFITERLLGILLALPFFAYACASDKLGGGDVKLIGCVGFMFGLFGGIIAIIIAFMLEYITILILKISHKHTAMLAMSPFFSGGIAVCLVLSLIKNL